MGPFPGRLIQVSTGVMDGCRPSTPHTVGVDTRFMAQWMQAFRSCKTSITCVGWSKAEHRPLTATPKTKESTSKVRQLVEKLTSTSDSSSSKKTSDKIEESKETKKSSGRRKNRRKQS